MDDRAELRDEPRIHRASGWLRRLTTTWRGTPPLARAGIVAQLALVVVLAGALFAARGRRAHLEAFTPSHRPVGATWIGLGFAEGTSEAELRALLSDIGGEIVAGPSALGLYTVVVPGAPAEANALVERLHDDPRVRYAGRLR
jgi:hypothetical protein